MKNWKQLVDMERVTILKKFVIFVSSVIQVIYRITSSNQYSRIYGNS